MAYTTIDDPSAYFQTALFTGNGGTNAITNTGNSDLQPNMIWFKCRSATEHHGIFDSVRGVTKVIYPNLNNAQDNVSDSLASFNSDGFTMGADTGSGGAFNGNTKTMAAWQWKESATAGMDVLTYEGTGSIQTEAHNLGVKPDMIIVKNIDSSDPPFNWRVYHSSLGAGVALKLNANDAISDDPGYWGDTEPTSSVFSIKDSGETNNNNQTYMAYLFAGKQGYSKFGSYVGNNNADGTFVYTGFKPALVIAKNSGATEGWSLFDNKRSTSGGNNVINDLLVPSSTEAEISQNVCDFVSNGFKFRHVDGKYHNNGGTYIYMAFAEQPFVTSTGVPATAR